MHTRLSFVIDKTISGRESNHGYFRTDGTAHSIMEVNDSYTLIAATKPADKKHGKENAWVAGAQMFASILLSGNGMVAASVLLDRLQYWRVFEDVSELYILVPALIGLKGNLEMTLTSRLSTHAHLGHLKSHLLSLIIGNLCLIQCQAVLVGFLAAVAAMAMGWIPDGTFPIDHAILLCASSMLTASLASLVLSSIMIAIIVLASKLSINPDNVATPLAASMGDMTTLTILSYTTSFLYGSVRIVPSTIIFACAVLVPVCGYVAWRNRFTKQALEESWVPVVTAMVISSAGGLILDYTISSYKNVATFQLIINGIGGNVAAVHASKLSTTLHLGEGSDAVFGTTARLLMLMVVPCQLVLVYTTAAIQGHISVSFAFVLSYLIAAFLQVLLLLVLSHHLVRWMWRLGIDPDNSAIPYLTAFGDLLGTAFLGFVFYTLNAAGVKGD